MLTLFKLVHVNIRPCGFKGASSEAPGLEKLQCSKFGYVPVVIGTHLILLVFKV